MDGDCCAASITPAGAPLAQFFSTTRKCKAPRHCSTRAQREDETQWQQDAHTDRYTHTHTHTHTHTRTHARTHTHARTSYYPRWRSLVQSCPREFKKQTNQRQTRQQQCQGIVMHRKPHRARMSRSSCGRRSSRHRRSSRGRRSSRRGRSVRGGRSSRHRRSSRGRRARATHLLLVHLLLSGAWTKRHRRPLSHRAAELQTTKKRS